MSKRKNTSKKNKFRKVKINIIRVLGISLGVIILCLTLFYLSILSGMFGRLPTENELRQIENSNATEVYSADSVLLGRFYLQERTRADYNQISKNVINALVATEDVRFFEHEGVDYRSMVRVIFKTILLSDRTSGGGSTITQQLVKNLYPRKNYGRLSILVNKTKEAIIANRIESVYSKKEIITLYLNTVPFGENIYGIQVASKRFFNKKAKDLNVQEAAVLVGMLKANYTYNPRVFPENSLTRRNVVLHQMMKYGYLSELNYDSLRKLPIKLDYTKTSYQSGIATYFKEQVRKELEKWSEDNEKPDGTPYNIYTDGLKVYTTLDSRLQKYAEQVMQKHMKELQAFFNKHWGDREPWGDHEEVVLSALRSTERYRNMKQKGLPAKDIIKAMHNPVPMKIFKWSGDQEVKMSPYDSVRYYLKLLQTGMVAMEPVNGAIKAWIGGIDFEHFKYDHASLSTRRQVGSTFKPFVFAAALEDGYNPCKFISGEKVTYTNLDNWSPGNVDQSEYEMKYTFRGALAKSVNTVTIRVLEDVGIDKTIDLAQKAGIVSELPEVASIALGTAAISLTEMVAAYASFANGGYAVDPHFIKYVTNQSGDVVYEFKEERNKERVLSPDNAIIMNSLLQAVVNEGTAGRYRWKYGLKNELAGKTGTTQSNTDGWFIGYNPKIVVGSWVGADNPIVRFRTTSLGSGANTALPMVAMLFDKMQNDDKLKAIGNATFPEVPGRLRNRIDCKSEKEDKAFMEWLFGKKKQEEKEVEFDQEEEEGTSFFKKIGNIFKGKK